MEPAGGELQHEHAPPVEARATKSHAGVASHSLLDVQRVAGNHSAAALVASMEAPVGFEGGPVDIDTESAIDAVRGRGNALNGTIRREMEGAFGADFSNVRLHDNAGSDALNRRLTSMAFTTGSDIFFRRGELDSSSDSGRELLAHELAHVVQQSDGESSAKRKIYRRLDANKYSQQGNRTAGMKPGFRLIGTSPFGKVEAALTAYHATTQRPAEYAALQTIITRCNEWLAKNDGDSDKMTFVQDLKRDAQLETDQIKSTLDEDTFASMKGDDKFAAAVNTLGTALGLSTAQLAALSADQLKSVYVERIYVPYKMGEKAREDVAELQRLHRLIEATNNAPVAQLPDGDVKTVITAIQQSAIGTHMLNMAKAPKHMAGGSATQKSAPVVPGWNAGNEVAVTGNAAFRQTVDGLLRVIGQTDVGQLLLSGIGGKAPTDTWAEGDAKKTVLEISPPSVSSAQRVAGGGEIMFSNSASANKVAVDPSNDVVGADASKVDDEPWRLRDGAIALFHEMIHVYLAGTKGEEFVAQNDPSKKMTVGSEGDLAELRIVGIRYETGKGDAKAVYPFEDPTYNPITENEFRRQVAILRDLDEYYQRPSYANVAGQVPLGTDAIPL